MKQYTPEELNQLSKEEIMSLLMQAQNEAARFKERLEELQMHLFGRSTERLECLGQLSAFNEAEIVCDEEEKEPEIEDAVVARSKRPRGKLAEDLKDLPTRKEMHELSEDELTRIFGQDGWKRLPDEISWSLEYHPSVKEAVEHHTAVYAAKNEDRIVRAPRGATLLAHSIATPSLVAAIMNEHHHRAIRLDADGRAGGAGDVVQTAAGMAILKDIAEAGDRFQNIACRIGGVALLRAGDVRIAALVDPEGRTGRRVDLRAAHDKSAAGSAVAHVVAAGVDRADNIGLATGLHALRLLGRFRHGPVPAAGDGFDVIVAVADRNGSRGAVAHFDLHHMTHHLLGQCAIVQYPFVFLDIGCHGIFLFGYLPDTQRVKSTATCDLRCLNLCR